MVTILLNTDILLYSSQFFFTTFMRGSLTITNQYILFIDGINLDLLIQFIII